MLTQWMQIAAVAAVLTISGPVPGIAQSSQPKSDVYMEWGTRVA